MTAEASICLQALDALALALAEHHHVWTDEERTLYEQAIAAHTDERSADPDDGASA